MKSYRINEIFYSLQGEGARAGSANVFIRFAGCDLTCVFCDTEFESYTEMTAGGIIDKVEELMQGTIINVIMTGGEPTLQYDQELCDRLLDASVGVVAIETNGGTKLKAPASWISCSPKVAEHVVAKNFPEGVDELRYVRHVGQGIPKPAVLGTYLYLSPEFNGESLNRDSLDHCIKLIKENPEWRLSVQQHKMWKVR